MTAVAVIGGGLAGAGAATALALAGREVTLFERETGPHDKVCGGFLSFEAVESLRRLGVEPLGLGAAHIERLAVHVGRRAACRLPLPFPALSLSRRVLDEALLQRAQVAGAQVRRGTRVAGVAREGEGWSVQTAEGLVRASAVFLATGKRDLKGWKRPAGLQADLIGFRQHFALSPQGARDLAGAVELHLFPGGYAGLEPVEQGRANLCLAVRRSVFARLGGEWTALLDFIRDRCPALDTRLAGAVAQDARPAAIAAIPYGYVARAQDGLWRLGDQAAVIPSFAGEGLSIALHSAERAAAHLIAGRSARDYGAELSRSLSGKVIGSTWLSKAMVRGDVQRLILPGLAAAPGLVSLIARGTRLRAPPASALPAA